MKLMKILALVAALGLIAAACGDSSGDDPVASDGTQAPATTAAPDDAPATTNTPEDTSPPETAPPGTPPGEGGDLILLQWQAPSQANPYLSTGTKDLLAGSLVLEPLLETAPNGSFITALATEIPSVSNGGIAEDLTSITYHLQPGVLWSDGTPLTADDVVFSWQYCTDELTGCSADNFGNVVDVVAMDDLTVTLNFDGPTPFPFTAFTSFQNPILQRAQFQDCVGEGAKSCSDENFAPIGTGPYMVTELRPEDTVLYAFNPNYRLASEGKPFFGTITIKGGGDAEASARSVLEIGEADFAWNLQVAPELLGPMEAAGNGRVVVAFNSSIEHINLNQTDPNSDPPSEYADGANPNPFFFENALLARALSIAINRDELVAVGYGANGAPTCNIWPVGSQNSTNNDWCLTQDIDEANRILDEDLGYLDNDGDGVRELPDGTPLEWDYVTSTNAVRQSNQDLVKSYWEQIGVNVNMRNESASLFFDGTNASDVSIWKFFTDIEMFTNSSSNSDPQSYLEGWKCDQIPESTNSYGGSNIVRLCDAEFDALWDQLAQTALDDPARDSITIQLNDIISSRGSTIPLINRGSVSAWANNIEGTGELNGWDSQYYNIEDWFRS
jgi:peptide/nickel transport system substrate-binding protein